MKTTKDNILLCGDCPHSYLLALATDAVPRQAAALGLASKKGYTISVAWNDSSDTAHMDEFLSTYHERYGFSIVCLLDADRTHPCSLAVVRWAEARSIPVFWVKATLNKLVVA